jgi:hypothetical protein
MIPIIFKDSSPQSVDSSNSSDSEASDPEALLYFPDPDEQNDSVASYFYHSDKKNDLTELETYCDLPSTVQELLYDLLKYYKLSKSPFPTISGLRPLTDSETHSLEHLGGVGHCYA